MKKKVLPIICGMAATLCMGFVFAACVDGAGHEHVWDDGTVTVEPTCTSAGERKYTCTVDGCGETKTEVIDKIEHDWDDGVITAYPTLRQAGTVMHSCLYGCGETTTSEISPRDDYSYQFVTDIMTESKWSYGTATLNGADVAFERIFQTDEDDPTVWKSGDITISKDSICTTGGNAAIKYDITDSAKLKFNVAFIGASENTAVTASLIIGSNVVELNAENSKDWTYQSDTACEVTAGDIIFIVFANGGEGEASGKFSFSVIPDCVHDFTGELVNTDPDGHYHKCAHCDTTDGIIPHTFDYEKADGDTHKKVCECGFTITEEHRWDEGAVTTEATCTTDGVKTYTCLDCGEIKTQTIPQTGHDFTGELVNDDPAGHYHKCTHCNATETPVPHSFNYEKIDGDSHNKSCACGYATTEAHNWDEGKITKEPTETENGVRTYTCEDCNATKTEEVPMLGHEHTPSADWKYDETYHWHTCSDCTEKLDKAEHTWDDGEVTTEPTCHSDGVKTYTCTECGATKTEAITERPAHVWNDGEITAQPTFWQDGVKTYTCTNDGCGETKTEAVERLQTADFGKEFSMESNPNGSWSYGKVDYVWGDKEDFTFTAATEKNGGGDGWMIGGTEIKDGFINSDNWATVAFTFTEDTAATVNFKFTGNYDGDGNPNSFNCRIGVKDKDGNVYSNPVFMGGAGDPNVCANTSEYNFKAGDTIYFMIEHVGGWASGNLELTITRNAQTDAE